MKRVVLIVALLVALFGVVAAKQHSLQPKKHSLLEKDSDADASAPKVGKLTPETIDGPDSPPASESESQEHVTPELTDMLPPHYEEPKPENVEEHIVPEFKDETPSSACIPNCEASPEEFIEPEIREPEPANLEDGENVVRIVHEEEVEGGAQQHGEISSEDAQNALDEFEEGTTDLGELTEDADELTEDAMDDAGLDAPDEAAATAESLLGGDDEASNEGEEGGDDVTSTTTTITTVTTGPADKVNALHPEKVAAAVANVVHGGCDGKGEEGGNAEAGEAAEAAETASFIEKISSLRNKRISKKKDCEKH